MVLVLPTIWTYGGTDRNPTTLVAELATASAARAREHYDRPLFIDVQTSTGP